MKRRSFVVLLELASFFESMCCSYVTHSHIRTHVSHTTHPNAITHIANHHVPPVYPEFIPRYGTRDQYSQHYHQHSPFMSSAGIHRNIRGHHKHYEHSDDHVSGTTLFLFLITLLVIALVMYLFFVR